MLNQSRPLEAVPDDAEGGELVSDEARERAAVEHDRPGGGIVKARDTVEERRLTGAVGPDQAANGVGRYFDGAFAPRIERLDVMFAGRRRWPALSCR